MGADGGKFDLEIVDGASAKKRCEYFYHAMFVYSYSPTWFSAMLSVLASNVVPIGSGATKTETV